MAKNHDVYMQLYLGFLASRLTLFFRGNNSSQLTLNQTLHTPLSRPDLGDFQPSRF
jgi:hypothetical protein